MGHHYRFHLHMRLAASTPQPLLDWLAGTGSTHDMLAVLPPEEAGWLSELSDHQRDYFTIVLEPGLYHRGAVTGYDLMLATVVKDDDVMVTYGLPAALAPYADEGMIGTSWTDMQHECDPILFLVQGGRLYGAKRYEPPQHIALNGSATIPWTPFSIGDPESGRQP